MSARGASLLRRLDAAAPGFERELAALTAFEAAQDPAVDATVARIVADVRSRGDAALLEYTAQFDGVTVGSRRPRSRSAPTRCAAPSSRCRSAMRAALTTAAARIRAFHERQKLASWSYREADGSEFGQQVTPLDRVGIYVPGGKAAYPSSVLMNAIPAQVAGVAEIVMVVPTPGGTRNPLVLAAAHLAGVTARLRRSAARRRSRRSPTARRRSRRSTRSAGPATPMSPRRSAACSARSAST